MQWSRQGWHQPPWVPYYFVWWSGRIMVQALCSCIQTVAIIFYWLHCDFFLKLQVYCRLPHVFVGYLASKSCTLYKLSKGKGSMQYIQLSFIVSTVWVQFRSPKLPISPPLPEINLSQGKHRCLGAVACKSSFPVHRRLCYAIFVVPSVSWWSGLYYDLERYLWAWGRQAAAALAHEALFSSRLINRPSRFGSIAINLWYCVS
jgi:hypothetical protein